MTSPTTPPTTPTKPAAPRAARAPRPVPTLPVVPALPPAGLRMPVGSHTVQGWNEPVARAVTVEPEHENATHGFLPLPVGKHIVDGKIAWVEQPQRLIYPPPPAEEPELSRPGAARPGAK